MARRDGRRGTHRLQQRLDRDEDGPGRGAGLAWAATCSDGYDVENVATLHGRRGYVAFLASPTGLDDAGDRRVFESIRRSFRFDGAP
jgi:hypothetical protein